MTAKTYPKYPIFSGFVEDGRLRRPEIVGRALRPPGDSYFHIRLWLYPRIAYHLVKVDRMPVKYRLFGRVRTGPGAAPVFENPIGDAGLRPELPGYLWIDLNFPIERIYLRLTEWDEKTDGRDQRFKAENDSTGIVGLHPKPSMFL